MKQLLVLLTITTMYPAVLAAQGWDWQNPLPRGNTVNSIVMIDENRGVAVCDGGIMLRTANGGRSWVSYRIATVNLQHISRLDDGTLLIAADRRRILRSTDNGNSWVLVHQGGTQYAGYTSEIAHIDSQKAVAFLNGPELITTIDGGRTWKNDTSLVLFSESPRSIAVQSPSTWWLVTNRNTWMTANGGRSWSVVNSDYPPVGLQRFVFIDSLYGYQCRDGQLLRTHDGGASWEEMNIFGFDLVRNVAAGPKLGDDVYCLSAGRYLINKSPDAGESWNISLTESAFADANVSAMTFVNSKLGFLVGDGGRILRTNNGGNSWSIVHGLGYIGTIAGIHFFDEQDGIAFTYSSTVLLSSNGGNRWDEAIPSAAHTLRQWAVTPSGTMYSIGFSSSVEYQLFRSSDRGKHWETVGPTLPIQYSPNNQLIPQTMIAVSDQELLISSSYARLYRSTDAGMTWDSLFVTSSNSVPFLTGAELQFFPPATIYYSLYNGLAVSTDQGATWEIRQAPFGASMMNTRFTDEMNGFSVIQGRLSSTSDGGKNWKRITELNTELYHFFDPMNGVMLSSDIDNDNWAWLYRTNNGGADWTRESLGGQVNWNKWFFLTREIAWAVSYGGLIQKTINGGIAGISDINATPETVQLGPSWPNPFQLSQGGLLHIPFSLDRDENIRLSLFDMLGREIAVISDGPHQRGRHTATLQLKYTSSAVTPGMYILRLQSSARIVTSAVIIR